MKIINYNFAQTAFMFFFFFQKSHVKTCGFEIVYFNIYCSAAPCPIDSYCKFITINILLLLQTKGLCLALYYLIFYDNPTCLGSPRILQAPHIPCETHWRMCSVTQAEQQLLTLQFHSQR